MQPLRPNWMLIWISQRHTFTLSHTSGHCQRNGIQCAPEQLSVTWNAYRRLTSKRHAQTHTYTNTHLDIHIKQYVQQVLVRTWQHRVAFLVGGEHVGGQQHSFHRLSEPSLHLLRGGELQGGAGTLCVLCCARVDI